LKFFGFFLRAEALKVVRMGRSSGAEGRQYDQEETHVWFSQARGRYRQYIFFLIFMLGFLFGAIGGEFGE
jgi:hypothetical protein